MFASEKGNIEIVEALLTVVDIDINMRNKVRKEVIADCSYRVLLWCGEMTIIY